MDEIQSETSDLDILLQTESPETVESFVKLLHRDELLELVHQLPLERWKRVLRFLHPSELAALLTLYPTAPWSEVLTELDDEQTSALLTELSEPELTRFLTKVHPDSLPSLLSEMDSDDAADLLGDLSQREATEILEKMTAEDSEPIKELLKYKDDSAGGLMQTEMIVVFSEKTVAQAIDQIRDQVKQYEGEIDVYEVFVVDEERRFQGQVALERLILAPAQTSIQEIIRPQVYWVTPEMDQEQVASFFQRYNLVTLPVVDQERRLLGRITVDDVVDVMEEEASEDILQMAGAGGDDLAHDSVSRSAFLRLPWLLTNLFGGLLTGYLMSRFEATLKEIIALVAFIPVITGMGGNVGTQASTITIRGFAIGRIDFSNLRLYLRREMRIGATIGLICGLALTLIGFLWKANFALGLVVGISLFVAMTVASTSGCLLPAIFQKLNIDPALAAGPFVTTANDITGILIYMTTATFFLSWLR